MDFKDLAGLILNNAPKLGTMIGSVAPGVGTVAGGAIGIGIKSLAKAFGLAEDTSPEQIAQAIQADPDKELKLQVAENEFQAKMAELANERYRLESERLRDENDSYRAELATRTVPWVDALHKMGRLITNWAMIIAWAIGAGMGHTFTEWDVVIIGGGNLAYQIIKGRGTQPK